YDEVDARLGGPRDLLVEHRLDGPLGFGVFGGEDVRVADVAGEERAGLVRDLLREHERISVQLLEEPFLADDTHLLAVRVVGERLDDIGARMHELPMEVGHLLRVVEDGLGDERAGLDEPAPLELEEIALRADDLSLLEALEKSGSGHSPSLGDERACENQVPHRLQVGREGVALAHERTGPADAAIDALRPASHPETP